MNFEETPKDGKKIARAMQGQLEDGQKTGSDVQEKVVIEAYELGRKISLTEPTEEELERFKALDNTISGNHSASN
jgi:hypothetical protein